MSDTVMCLPKSPQSTEDPENIYTSLQTGPEFHLRVYREESDTKVERYPAVSGLMRQRYYYAKHTMHQPVSSKLVTVCY